MHDRPGNKTSEIRIAVPADLSQIVGIYNYFILHSHATFDVLPYSVGERVPWFAQFAAVGPHVILVAEVDGKVLGWCCSTQFKERPAYAVSVETTVYVDHSALGRGIGRQLYDALFDRLHGQGLHGAYAGITLPNEASVRLHESLGFTKAGEFREVGYKFEQYWTVAWYEKRLAD